MIAHLYEYDTTTSGVCETTKSQPETQPSACRLAACALLMEATEPYTPNDGASSEKM